MKLTYSKELYNVNSLLINNIATLISITLSVLYNTYFIAGYFPDPIKMAKVIQIYKKGIQYNIENYI